VGVTIIDDQSYRPRRCIWAHPPFAGALRLRFANVPLGRTLRGFAGLSYFLFRDGWGEPVELGVRVDDAVLGSYRHHDEWGWHAFSLSSTAFAGRSATVEVEVRAERAEHRDFCFALEAVE